jgi:hypothetical protein
MKIMFGFLWKNIRKLWRSDKAVTTGIDTHKWESKIEIYRSFRHY